MQVSHFIVVLSLVSLSFCFSNDDRVVGWNKAHGLWGKRSVAYDNVMDQQQNKRTAQNWNKLNSLWGKRSANLDEFPAYIKRAQPAQWQMANGLWGR